MRVYTWRKRPANRAVLQPVAESQGRVTKRYCRCVGREPVPSWSPVVCGLWSVLDESVRIQRCAAEMKSQIALPRFSRHVGRFTGTRASPVTHVDWVRSRECKPTCTVSARRSLSALPPRYSRRVQRNLGLWGLRWCAALDVRCRWSRADCCHHAGSAGAGRQPGLRPAIDGCHHRAAYIDNR